MSSPEVAIHHNSRGLAVAPCANCGRWTSASMRTCCVPCTNGPEPTHQWLCEYKEHLRQYYPTELIGETPVCPTCGAVGVYEYESFGTLYNTCPSTQCGWRVEKELGADGST